MTEPTEDLSNEEKRPRRTTREELLYDYFLENTREIISTVEAAIAEAAKTARDISGTKAAFSNAARDIETITTSTVEKISARAILFEKGLVDWSRATQTRLVIWVVLGAFCSSFLGSITAALVFFYVR